jgi:UDP-glucose 4-epimerase
VVLASSAAVYGRNQNVPLAEGESLDPLSPYALHKRICEDYARLYSDLYDLQTVALRYFNVYGPRQDPTSPYSGVIARFADAARHGCPVVLTGDGSQTRDFVFVDDVARANVSAVGRELGGHQVINVATGRETSLLELRRTIEEVMGCPLPYSFAPPRPGDIYRSCADVSCLRDQLDVTACTPLAAGLRELLG